MEHLLEHLLEQLETGTMIWNGANLQFVMHSLKDVIAFQHTSGLNEQAAIAKKVFAMSPS